MEHRSGRIARAPAVKATDKGRDWRAEVGARSDSASPVDLARAREPGRGREANTPEQIPPRGWRDIFWRVFWSISEDRILSTSGSVAFFALLAIFPGIAAIVPGARSSSAHPSGRHGESC
jgi:membrane protein